MKSFFIIDHYFIYYILSRKKNKLKVMRLSWYIFIFSLFPPSRLQDLIFLTYFLPSIFSAFIAVSPAVIL